MSSNGADAHVNMTMNNDRWWLLLGLAFVGWLLYLLSPILTPFVISAMLAYLGDPLVDRLEARRIPRSLAVSLVFVVIFLFLLVLAVLLIPRLESQITTLLQKAPDYLAWIRAEVVPWLQQRLQLQGGLDEIALIRDTLTQHWQQAGGLVAGAMSSVSRSGLALLGWLANLVLIPVVTFYLLRDWDRMIAGIQALLPRNVAPTIGRLARESDEVLGAFLRGQLLVMFALGVIYTTGLWLVGLEFALLIGMFAGLMSFVPYLGLILGVLVAGVAAVLQFHDLSALPWVVLVFVVGQLVEGTVLTPKLVGDRIGMHPVAVIFAVMAGGQLYGFFGILLALPVAAVSMVLVRHALDRYRASGLYAG